MSLKVMTWNVENLFPAGIDAGPRTADEYQRKLDALVAVIRAQDPDVLALQEVGDQPSQARPRPLEDLTGALGDRTAFVAAHFNPNHAIRCALVVKDHLAATIAPELFKLNQEPPLVFFDLKGTPLGVFGRGVAHVTIAAEGQTIHVLSAHLKSKLLQFGPNRFTTSDENERARVGSLALSQRLAEAAALRLTVNKLRRDRPDEGVIVLGDLNDVPDAATTQLLYGPPGSQPDVAEDGREGAAFGQRDGGDPQRLFNLTGFIPPSRRHSRVFKGRKELIDHILVSVNLVPQETDRQKRRPVLVDALVNGGPQGGLESIDESPTERQGKPASDHAPIIATFNLG